MFAVSFVIPVLNEERRLVPLLEQLQRDFPDCERIVVDGGSIDESVTVALPRAHAVLLGPRGRARQMNLGAATASGEYLCFLHADSAPSFGQQALVAALASKPSWAYCRLRLSGRHRALSLISTSIHWRSRLTRVVTGDQTLLVKRAVFEALKGFADIPLMEDVEICRRLRKHGPPRSLPLSVSSSGRRWEEQGVSATVVRMWGLRLAYRLGVSPQRLWRFYYGPAALSPAAQADGDGH